MVICGVELTGSDAVICILAHDRGQFSLPDNKVRKLSLRKDHGRTDLLQFQKDFDALLTEYGVTRVVIRERMQKGKFAGGAISFKLEATIQLIDRPDLDVRLVSPAQIKSALAAHPMPVPFSETGIKAFQETAFTVAYVGHVAS